MRVLVTGSEGTLGRPLVRHLQASGYTVYRVDLKYGWGDDYRSVDCRHHHDLVAAFKVAQPDVVYNLASCVGRYVSERRPTTAFETNTMAALNVVLCCLEFGSRLVHLSTSEVYGPVSGMDEDAVDMLPNNIYGTSKYLGEQVVRYYARHEGLKAVVVRPFMMYTEDDDDKSDATAHLARPAINIFVSRLCRGETITVHKGAARGWLHVSDGVEALARIAHLEGREALNIGHPDVISLEELGQRICRHLDLEPAKHIDVVAMPDKTVPVKNPSLRYMLEILKFRPRVSLDEGIERLIKHEREQIA